MATVTPAIQSSIAHLYIALFGRAPDAAGFAFWTQALADGASLASITLNFIKTPEARTIYTESQTSTQFVTAYYASVMGRAPDASGLAFWTAALDAAGGAASDAARAQIVSQIVGTVSTSLPVKPADLADAAYALTVADRNVFSNKTTVGIYYATEYKGTDLNLAKQVLAVVGSSGSTVDIAKGILTGGNSPASPPAAAAPKNFTGTTGVDNFVGDTGNDTFAFVINKTTPANTTLNATDVLTGGAGDDTLTLATTGAVTKADLALASISGVENLVLQRAAGSSVAMSAWAGLAKVTVDSGTGTLQIEDLSNNLSLSGSTNGAITLVYQAPVTEARLALDSMSAGTVFQGTSLTSITLTSSGSASFAGITTSSNVRALNLVANGALGVTQITGTDVTVNVSGTAAVQFASLTPSIKAVDASANSGGLTASLSSSNPGVSVKGSSGNDTISTNNTVLTTGSVDAGAGTADRLIVGNNSSVLNSPALGAKYTGFEILRVTSGVSVDMDNIGGISSVELADNYNPVTGFSNLTKAQAESVSILRTSGTGVITLGTKDATVDTVNATVATTTNSGLSASNIDLSTLTLSNSVKTLALTGNSVVGDPIGSVTLTTANALGLETITVKSLGAVNVTVSAAHTATGLSIDASQSTGVVTINASAYNTATGANIKGGSGGGTLTGSGKGDTIVGGAGIDTIVSGGSAAITGGTADTLRGNGGADTFVFSTADNATAHGNVTATIQDFQVGIDKIQLTVSGPSGAATFQKGGIAADLATLLTSADNALDGTVRVYVGQVGADSIVVSDLNGTGYTEVIRLTGVSVSDITLGDFVAPPP